MPEAFERCTYVHMANLALFTLIVFWQPIPFDVWNITDEVVRKVLWLVFGGGWLLLFMAAMSFGIRELLGLDQMMAWRNGRPAPPPRLKTGGLYRWLRHPMYAGVLTGIWAVPRMTAGHLLLAAGFTGYVLIALRYEEHDLLQRFGRGYANWRRTLGGREPE
jgi:protein-S-isoprenylcysteine O-methyltransferase Ste14